MARKTGKVPIKGKMPMKGKMPPPAMQSGAQASGKPKDGPAKPAGKTGGKPFGKGKKPNPFVKKGKK